MKNITIHVSNDFNERVPEGYSQITDGNACLKIKIIIKPLREANLGEAQV